MRTLYCLSLFIFLVLLSCSPEEVGAEEEFSEDPTAQEEDPVAEQEDDCPNVGFVFEESDGIISIEFENNDFPDGWKLKTDVANVSGQGYMQWEGSPSLSNPGNGKVTFPLKITNTGTYRFIWRSSFRKGSNGTEHNDTWLRFPDAKDFFGENSSGSKVYPSGVGKSPNPHGASKDGWFKIYRSGNNNDFNWQARTSDNDAHDIYVIFDSPGVFLLEVSARSDFHGIDRMLLFKENISQNDALGEADTFSNKISCN